MKNFLLPALVLTLAAGASAQTLTEVPFSGPKAVKAAASNDTWKDIGEGVYSDFIISNILKGQFNDPVKVQVQESEQTPGRYRLVNPWPSVPKESELNYLIIDASDPDFVIIAEAQSPVDDPDCGETWYCSCTYYMTEVVGMDKETLKAGEYAWIPKVKDGVINFTTTSLALSWPYSSVYVPAGEWSYSNMEYTGYFLLPGAEKPEEWKSYGTGKMFDGAIWQMFEKEPASERDVEVFENIEKPGIFRIAGAFTGIVETARDLVIDATDPGFCRIYKQNTGINTRDYGWTYIFSNSTNGSFEDYDDMIAQFPDWEGRNITLDENGFNIPRTTILTYFPEYDSVNVVIDPECVDSYIHFTYKEGGVENISASESAEVEYYNLQGLRVKNPRKGQLVIGRRGTETFKTIIP